MPVSLPNSRSKCNDETLVHSTHRASRARLYDHESLRVAVASGVVVSSCRPCAGDLYAHRGCRGPRGAELRKYRRQHTRAWSGHGRAYQSWRPGATGTPLFSLDDRDLRAELALRKSYLEIARARLARLEHAPRPEELPPAQAKVREAEAALADAHNQQRLIESVTDKRAIREEDLLRRREATNSAAARLEAAKASLALLKAGTWGRDLEVGRAEVANAAAQVHRAEADLERLTMRAPIDGEILQLNIRAGEYAPVGQLPKPLLVIGEVGQLHVRADIDENDAWRVQPGGKAEAVERGNSGRRAKLEFVRFEPYVIPKKSLTGDSTERVDTRVLQAIYRFTERSGSLYVGQQMDIFIETPPPTGFAADSARPQPVFHSQGGIQP